MNLKYRKILINEFDKLKRLFPSDDKLWNKYRLIRLEELKNKEVDVFVIDFNQEFIGEITVNYVSHSLESETVAGRRVYLEAFRLLSDYQGMGLGQELLKYVIDYLKELGYTEFTIGVEDDNLVARHIYSKYGFTEPIDEGIGDEFDPCKYTLYLYDSKKI